MPSRETRNNQGKRNLARRVVRRPRLLVSPLASLRALVAVVLVAVPCSAQRTAARPRPAAADGVARAALARIDDSTFAATVARLSEPSGYFDTDNLISNESSYLHVLPRLRAMGTRGGGYIGVGPDQNYSYIAAIRPRVAYLVDVRRDNLLQHLMFRSLFARSDSRLEYLCQWLGRRCPPDLDAWRERPVDTLARYLDSAPRDAALVRQVQAALAADARASGLPLSAADLATIRRFHDEFARDGLALRFTSHGRSPQDYYPSLRDLVVARDAEGRQGSYLASDDDWRYLKALHAANRVIPVVGNLAGTRALAGIARELRAAGEVVSAFYTSNVEFYLWGDGSFDAFARNVVALPRDGRSVIVRSFFNRFREPHPLADPGHQSVQLLHRLDDFAARASGAGWPSYRTLVTADAR
jgi:hypothetical protein